MIEDTFFEKGYVIVEDIIPMPAITRLQQYLQSNVDFALSEVYKEVGESDRNIPALVKRLADKEGFEKLSAGTKSILSGHFPLSVRLSEELWAVPRAASFRKLIEKLVGSADLRMHMPPAARFVLPGNVHAGVPAHQDYVYGNHMSDFITVWVPLVDIDDKCGGLAIFEGSHLKPIAIGDSGGPFWLEAVPTKAYRRVECPIRAGGAIIMNKYIIHESIGNRATHSRLSIDYRFFGKESTSTKHFLDMQSWKVVAPGSDASH
ncbi:MAG TPA: phytanoyl-CoA dioxygenase family protein [Pseudolabrys sp.]|nr:phytanoyl-CoA dioxygenase family protein [Pseudolabrys sp.]